MLNYSKNLSKTVVLNSKTIPSYTKLDTILYLPYLKTVRQKLQKLHLVDKGYEEKFAAFTLQETLIALTILGVVASITIPSLIQKYIEATNRTKVKKAVASYEKALNQMIIDNDVKGAVGAALNTTNCTIITEYFKKIAGSGCRFQTSDKVWWDISDIERPVISLKEELTDEKVNAIRLHPENYMDDENMFLMMADIDDNGILRINDKKDTELTEYEREYLDALYGFMNNNSDSPAFPDAECTTDSCASPTLYGQGMMDKSGNIIRQTYTHTNDYGQTVSVTAMTDYAIQSNRDENESIWATNIITPSGEVIDTQGAMIDCSYDSVTKSVSDCFDVGKSNCPSCYTYADIDTSTCQYYTNSKALVCEKAK